MIDMNEIMKKAQELSENMKQQQEELAKQTFTVSVGGEMVKMTFNGKQEAKSIEIELSVLRNPRKHHRLAHHTTGGRVTWGA